MLHPAWALRHASVRERVILPRTQPAEAHNQHAPLHQQLLAAGAESGKGRLTLVAFQFGGFRCAHTASV